MDSDHQAIDESLKLIELLTQATSHAFNADKTRPSVVISYLPTKEYYVSIARYTSAFARDKQVVFKTRHQKLTVAIERAARWVAASKKRDPIDLLSAFLDGSQDDEEELEEIVEADSGTPS